MIKISKSLEDWIEAQGSSAEGIYRPDMARRMKNIGSDCRLLYRVVKQVAERRGYSTTGRWRDFDDRRFSRFTIDKGKPRIRATIADRR